MSNHLIDAYLKDFSSPSEDPTIQQGLQRGQDFRAITEKHDLGILDEICGGEHNPGQSGPVGLIASDQDWRSNGAKPFTAEDSVMGDVLDHADDPQDGGKRASMTVADVRMRVKVLRHLGYGPSRIASYVNKLAEQQLFDRQLSTEFLQGEQGAKDGIVPGKGEGEEYGLITPNTFNQHSCVASLKHIKAHGQLRGTSVRRIAACTACENCKKSTDGTCKCAAYGLPIVANGQELQKVLASFCGGPIKLATINQKLYGEAERPSMVPGHSVMAVERQTPRDATEHVANVRVAGEGSVTKFDAQALREASGPVSPKVIQAAITAGHSITEVYGAAKAKFGSATAQKGVKTYLDGLKKSGARINLASIDCSLLKHRLTASETIIGKSSCATCDARNCMHCGRTGGTLLSFPGMETTGSKRASLQTPSQDGVDFMNQIELTGTPLEVTPWRQD